MKRRTLDLLVSLGGLLLAGLLLVAGLVLTSNAKFANDYVADQLGQQNITFKPPTRSPPKRRNRRASSPTPGKSSPRASRPSATPTTSSACTSRASLAARPTPSWVSRRPQLKDRSPRQTTNAPDLADLQKQLTDVTATRETVFKGETLRGLLLTSYGFSEFGDKAGQAATVAYIGAGLFLLSLLGLVHAYRTPKSAAFAPPEPDKS